MSLTRPGPRDRAPRRWSPLRPGRCPGRSLPAASPRHVVAARHDPRPNRAGARVRRRRQHAAPTAGGARQGGGDTRPLERRQVGAASRMGRAPFDARLRGRYLRRRLDSDMGEGPERIAPGPRRGSGVSADLDLRDPDWRALIEQLPLAVYIDRLDEWSTNVYTSPQIEAILGYTAAEWAAGDRLLLRILHPDDRERVLAAHRHSCETGEPFAMEYRLIARDGRVVWFLDRATVVPDRSGGTGFHHGFLLDISERKELEGALATSTEKLGRQNRYFESLLEISPAAIVTMNLDHVVTSWNTAAESLFGYTAQEAIGRNIDDLEQ